MIKLNTIVTQIKWASLCLIMCFSSTLMAKTYSENFAVESGGTLDIKTDIGAIEIRTHQKSSIELILKVESDDEDKFRYQTEQSGGNLSITGKLASGNRWGNNLRVQFELIIPEHYNINLQTSAGSLNIADLNGQVNARTSGGSIRVGNIVGDVELNTSGGSISTAAITGNVNAHTSGGSINVIINKQPSADSKLSTSGGSITAELIKDIEIDLYASTSGGRVKTDFEVDGSIKKQSIKGKINGGGPRLTLTTSGGSIRINSL